MRRLLLTFLLAGLPSIALAEADLVITDITLDPASPAPGDGTLTATLKNVGDDDAGTDFGTNPINLTMYLDGVECDTGLLYGLDAGDEATEETGSCNPTTPGPHKIKFVIDTDGDIDEGTAGEANNELEKTFIWSGADLVFLDITIDPASPEAGDGTLTATIKNIGGADADGSVTNPINITMFLDGEECATGFLYGLDAGEEATEETGGCNPETPGEHTIKFVIDVDGQVPETNESNNEFEKKFTWSGPDLIVSKIVVEPDPPKSGEDTKFTATFLNQGPYGVGITTFINIKWELDGAECDDHILFGLGDGAEKTEETSKCVAQTPGPHSLVVTIDVDEDVGETIETNNSLTYNFTVGTGGPAVELCNGKDDDADNQTDETFKVGEDCDGDDADKCKLGKTECAADGKTAVCKETAAVGVETCNAKDDDCDGKTDEDFADVGKACTPEGGCGTGKNVCKADGTGTTCESTGAASTAKETCNGKDDDCDGKTDEDFAELNAPCSAGVGECQAIGKYACAQGKATCNAAPKTPGAEKADAKDNDCDGATDEATPCTPGSYIPCGQLVGACAGGTQACTSAGTLSKDCVGATAAKAEACGNAIDEDCDGTTDENCTCAAGTTRPCTLVTGCGTGTQTCGGATWGACAPLALVAEVCGNAKDDDCDGEAEEGCPCSGSGAEACAPKDECASYARTCEGGVLSPCEPVAGTEVAGCGGSDGSDATDGGGDVATGAETPGPGTDTTSGNDDTGGIVIGPGGDASGDVGGTVGQTVGGGSEGCTQSTSGAAPWTLLLGLVALFGFRRFAR